MKKLILMTFALLFSFSAKAIEVWEVEAGVEIPFQIAARAKANFNSEFYATAGLGMSMDFLMGINSSVVGGAGILGENSAEVVESALSNSIVLDVRGGWNLHQFNGLYIEAGYLYMMGGGSEVTVDQLEGAFGVDYTSNPGEMSGLSSFSIGSDIHALTAHAGYRWEINNTLLFNVDVGLIKPFMSETTVDIEDVVRGTGSQAQANSVASDLKAKAESDTDEIYVSQLFIPTITTWITYSF